MISRHNIVFGPIVDAEQQMSMFSADRIQLLMNQFTQSNRHWTGYGVEKIEHVLRFYGLIVDGQYYKRLVSGNPEMVEFSKPSSDIHTKQYKWRDRISILFTGEVGKIRSKNV